MNGCWLQADPFIDSNEAYGWHFQYLTIIGLALATMTFTAGALADITLSSRMFRLKNVLSMCSAPLECLISALYWGIRAVDPRLVVPAELELDFLPGTDLDSWLHVILRPLDSNPFVSDDSNYLVTIY